MQIFIKNVIYFLDVFAGNLLSITLPLLSSLIIEPLFINIFNCNIPIANNINDFNGKLPIAIDVLRTLVRKDFKLNIKCFNLFNTS